jgi:hypothetical protein
MWTCKTFTFSIVFLSIPIEKSNCNLYGSMFFLANWNAQNICHARSASTTQRSEHFIYQTSTRLYGWKKYRLVHRTWSLAMSVGRIRGHLWNKYTKKASLSGPNRRPWLHPSLLATSAPLLPFNMGWGEANLLQRILLHCHIVFNRPSRPSSNSHRVFSGCWCIT